MIFHRSVDVPKLADYRQYRDPYLRPDFNYRCAYCLLHERFFLEADGGEIDHHRPINPPRHVKEDFGRLVNEYSNLYWTCGKCNAVKANTWPTEEQQFAGFRFLDPCQDDHLDHWQAMPDGTLRPTSSVGMYTVRHIRLNRSFLIGIRKQIAERRQKIAQVRTMLATMSLDDSVRKRVEEVLSDDYLINDELP